MELDQLKVRYESRVEALYITQHLISQKLDLDGWLSNFEEEERHIAYRLVNGLIYISDSNTDILLANAIKNLSNLIPDKISETSWKEFFDSLIFCSVRDTSQNPTDSGQLFVGKLKKILPIDESRIIDDVWKAQAAARDGKIVVFVDDFVGSGNQFKGFADNIDPSTQSNLSGVKNYIYCPIICTTTAKELLSGLYSFIEVAPLFTISDRYSVNHPSSVVWPGKDTHWISETVCKIREVSSRAGIPDDQILGYYELGLAIAFQHSVPDATLPIFSWTQNSWRPLFR